MNETACYLLNNINKFYKFNKFRLYRIRFLCYIHIERLPLIPNGFSRPARGG